MIKQAGKINMTIVAQAQTGNNEALSVLYTECKPLVYGMCMQRLQDKSQSEDLTHDIFELVLKHLPKLKAINSFPRWLYVITQRKIDSLVQQTNRQPLILDCLPPQIVDYILGEHINNITR